MLPDYRDTEAAYESLKDKCEKEFQRNEEELTRNYVSFLNDREELPEPILRKRQKELQTLVDRSVNFRLEMKKWLAESHDSLFAPLYAKIDDAVARVCVHNKLDYAVDLDRAGYVFINPASGYDITNAIIGTIKQDTVAAESAAEPAGEVASDGGNESVEETVEEEVHSESSVQGAFEGE